MNFDAARVAKMVQAALRGCNPHAARARVIADEVSRHPDGMWYVPISVMRDTEHMAAIYEAFSEVEDTMEERESLDVLLVPRIIPFQKWEDVA